MVSLKNRRFKKSVYYEQIISGNISFWEMCNIVLNFGKLNTMSIGYVLESKYNNIYYFKNQDVNMVEFAKF